MTKFLHLPDRPMWHAHSNHIKEWLGIDPKAKLPAEGAPAKEIQGFLVWINPLDPKRKSARQHRVMARCLTCHWEGSAGRTHQHKCVEN